MKPRTWTPVVIVAGGLLCLLLAISVPRDVEPSEFLRFASEKQGEGTLETASILYRRSDGAEVTLIAAVHIADRVYYEQLNREFERYDALLYEMIQEKDARPDVRSDSPLSFLQRSLKNLLGLEFQLDTIDYSRKNFVHADMDPETFFRLQEERGESLLSLMLRAMLEQWKRQSEGKGSQLTPFHLLAALASKDRARTLKLFLATEFGDIEAMIAGVEEGGDGRGSVLLSGRNETAVRVLRDELARGRKKLGIFYGGAHMQDMEKRVRALGFRKKKESWFVAWDMRKP